MENIQRAIARQRQVQQKAEAFESPTINTVDDIRRVLAQLDPGTRLNQPQDDVELVTELIGSDGRKSTKFEVRTSTSSRSYRQILLEGFQIVKQRLEAAAKLAAEETAHTIEVGDRAMTPPPVVNTTGPLAMDAVIERLLGGYRNGQYVCWDLADGFTYRYEIFQHRLTRVRRDAGSTNSATGDI